ncbi:MAG TPA: hypothetical protein VKR30_03840 [Candidatus Limnocylindrales bacterium]|nr:hypothetical protein [Candidatus Limnocylindrales bacterium]
MVSTRIQRLLVLGTSLGILLLAIGAAPASASSSPREVMMPPRGAAHGSARPSHSSNLTYHGGVGGVGVETGADKVYLVFWGSQWTNNDPSGEAAILTSFFNHVGGSSWNNSVTQYCEGVASGTVTCGSSGTHATNPTGVLFATWSDSTTAAPAHPTQSQLAAEAIAAAAHFGNTTASKNTQVQYDILTATGNNASGAGTSYCAWHSSTPSSYGNIAYTNMPYVTDYGASCGAGFNGMSATAGITIVNGHEFAETETDIYPNGGWLDSKGAENGDKCAWISGSGTSASQVVHFGSGADYPVQSLWSNANNGCVISYP